jgi:Lrp/AsnC family transcriptional regulator, leucine-responsive regulatory protein
MWPHLTSLSRSVSVLAGFRYPPPPESLFARHLSLAPATAKRRPRRRDYRDGVEEIDRKILSLLTGDGRMSFTDLARHTGLSVSATHQRVRRLERRGLIRGYAAVIDPAEAGLPLTAFVSIKPFDPAAADDAPDRLAHLAAIEACHSVAGEENYILKVRVASPGDLENLLSEIRGAANVSTRTTIVLSTPYENRPPDL